MKPICLVIMCLVLSTASSCATVKHGTMQPISVKSDPPNAEIRVNGMSAGRTPTVLNLSRTSTGTGTVRVELDGYRPVDVPVKRRLSGAFWGNLLIGGVIGMGVDLISGAWANLDPKEINLSLTKIEPEVAATPPVEDKPLAQDETTSVATNAKTKTADTQPPRAQLKRACTTVQILSMKDSGLADTQIKKACD